MSEHRDNLRRMVEHLLAAEMCGDSAGMGEAMRVFPICELREVAKRMLAAGEDTKRLPPPPATTGPISSNPHEGPGV